MHLENLTCMSFAMLTTALRRTKEFVKKALKHNSMTEFSSRKRPLVTIIKKNEVLQDSSLKKENHRCMHNAKRSESLLSSRISPMT